MGDEKEASYRVPLFDGTNFPAWKFRMLTLLEEFDLVECIENEIADVAELKVEVEDTPAVKQEKKKALEKRQKKDKHCKSKIVTSIHDDQLEHLQGKTTPKEMWDGLVKIYERKSVAKRMHLNRQLHELRYTSGPLQEHFVKFDRMMRMYRNAGGQIDDIDIVCRLLLSLGTQYDAVVTSIESQPEEQLTMDFVKCRLLDEEIKRKGAAADVREAKNDSAAFSGSAGRKTKQKKKVFKCFGCQKEGHKLADCPEKKKAEKKSSSSAHVAESKKSGVMFLTDGKASLCKANRIQWFIDSGATEHICNNRKLFSKLEPLKEPMTIAVAKSGEWVTAKYYGDVPVASVVGDETIEAVVAGVVYIPEARCNLFSISKVESTGMKVVFEGGKVEILKDSVVVATGQRNEKLYVLNFYPPEAASPGECDSLYFSGKICKATELWHRRYGHLGERNLSSLMKGGMVKGFKGCSGDNSMVVCEPCMAAKQTRNPFALREERRSSRVLELVHSDVCGPVTPVGWDGDRYFATFIDDWTRFTMVFLIRSKDEVARCFKQYEAETTAKFGVSISRLRSDNGGEYISNELRSFCKSKGIKMEYTVPYTPEQNGVAERMNRTLEEKARSMLFDSGVDRAFWGEAVQTAAFLTNRSPASAIGKDTTPFEMWEGRKPDISKLRVFGSSAYCHIPKERRRKLDEKTWKGMFIGYGINGYRIWDPEERRIVTVRDVVVDESVQGTGSQRKRLEKTVRIPGDSSAEPEPDQDLPEQEESDEEQSDEEQSIHEQSDESGNQEDSEIFNSIIEEPEQEEQTEVDRGTESSSRNRRPPEWHKDYDTTFAGYAFGAMEFVENLPNTIAELRKRPDWPKWKIAVEEEMEALRKNKTWTLTKLPEGQEAITCKWVFRIKPGEGGEPDRYKARLVARGFSQRYGYDYTETYSPVAKVDTLRMMLAIANRERMLIHQLDVRTAFLNGVLSEEIFMCQPEGFERGDGLVCRLNRTLYGLKQASKAWNDRFHRFITQLGFRRTVGDECLYVRGEGRNRIFLILYVDDVLVIGHELKEIVAVKRSLAKEFEMKDSGEVSSFLGMRITRDIDRRVLRVSQQRYLQDLLTRFNMSDCNPSSVPMEKGLKLQKGMETNRTSKPYRELIGCLMYVALTTRPDLAVAVNYFSQFQSCPTEEHWRHLKRVLRYVKGTTDVGLEYTGNDGAVLVAFCDATWANEILDRKSVSGYLFKVFGCITTWSTRKQQTVSKSSTEAELIALCEATSEGVWITRLLNELGFRVKTPVQYFEDNQSAITVIEEPRYRGRLKHIDVKLLFLREMVQNGHIELKFVPSEKQEADILTKGLTPGPFQRLRAAIGLGVYIN